MSQEYYQTTILKMRDLIVEAYRKELSNRSEILSVFLVGSLAQKEARISRRNDLDIRIIVNEISEDLINEMEDIYLRIKQSLNEKYVSIHIGYSDFIGPEKDDADFSLLVHCILLCPEELSKLPMIHKRSYAQNNRLILGRDILKEYMDIWLSSHDVIYSPEGIDDCMMNILRRKRVGKIRTKNGKKSSLVLIEYDCSREEEIELCRYAVSKCTYNVREYLSQFNKEGVLDTTRYLDFVKELDTINNTNYEERISTALILLAELRKVLIDFEGMYERG